MEFKFENFDQMVTLSRVIGVHLVSSVSCTRSDEFFVVRTLQNKDISINKLAEILHATPDKILKIGPDTILFYNMSEPLARVIDDIVKTYNILD